jgi:hypothetical protein
MKLTKIYKQPWFPAIPKGFCTFVGMFFGRLISLDPVSGSESRIETNAEPQHWLEPFKENRRGNTTRPIGLYGIGNFAVM